MIDVADIELNKNALFMYVYLCLFMCLFNLCYHLKKATQWYHMKYVGKGVFSFHFRVISLNLLLLPSVFSYDFKTF